MLTFNTATEELFYLLDNKPGFAQELLVLADDQRLVGDSYVTWDSTCGCVYWAYFDCPFNPETVEHELLLMFELNPSQEWRIGNYGTMEEVSPLQYEMYAKSQAEINVWLRDRVELWRRSRA